jgi:hypothetical protein
MIKSPPQIGHRRKMASAQFAAQSVSSLSGETESGINRIVLHRGSVPPASTSQDQSLEAELLLPEQKNATGREYSFSAIAFQRSDSKDWPLIMDSQDLAPSWWVEPEVEKSLLQAESYVVYNR